jgi:hypothetical protein
MGYIDEVLRRHLITIEEHMNSLYGKMSPQLQMELEWRRRVLLRSILANQLKTFKRES